MDNLIKMGYREYKHLNLTELGKEVRRFWEDENIFKESLKIREGAKPFIFYEGPPSANGVPGIHHVMARAIKDIFCRYKTQKGFLVERKAGWDTHGLPVELGVEKALGITKEDIGKTITVEDYNKECRKDVMKYKDLWDELTLQMGYWVNLDDPYITFENKYIETLWYLLSEMHKKGLLYKGYSIQPYSPAAGTGLSTHELNQPGCYRNVKDSTVVAQFKVVKNEKSEFLFKDLHGDLFFLAWTTTPWTLPSNTALALGKGIVYAKVKTFNPYSYEPITVILAKNLLGKYFDPKNAELKLADYEAGQKAIPFEIIDEWKGIELESVRYEQLLPYAQPDDGDAFRTILGDFVTTEDGTGIVHIAPSFGADDFRVAKQNGIGALTLVDKAGKFVDCMGEFAGKFVKPEFDTTNNSKSADSVDIEIIVKLKRENRAFKTEKYEHSYPHCWRTDKPILYYPLDSWFIRSTAVKDRMIELNKTINWKPEATGTGRFGNWLENLVDWNLSRSRYWGTPLPIWRTEDGMEEICIGSIKQLKEECEKSVKAGLMQQNPIKEFNVEDFSADNYGKIDLHRPYVDDIVLVSASGKPMKRETDLIDVWFDSGAMPYAQFHYPFENNNNLSSYFPADFIAEGVDQTRGWFFTLHAIATMMFDDVAYKNVVSNGLVLDKNGNKMSKRLGNGVDPFKTIEEFGPDATRWYMITNSQPWDNLKFDIKGVDEVRRKFFGTLYNTYSFFALYANIDGFKYKEANIEHSKRPEIDRWILSELNTLIETVDRCFADYDPTMAGRAIAEFVDIYLSNWYVRLCRRRFWKGDYTEDKISAYQTLYTCLETIARLMAPIAPFFADRLFKDLNDFTHRIDANSVHLTDFPVIDARMIDKDLEERMQLAQQISSMVLSLRKRTNLRVRQPLSKIMIPATSEHFRTQIEKVKELILSEVNVKDIEYITDSNVLVKSIKADFKKLGAKCGKMMKDVASAIARFTNEEINALEKTAVAVLNINGVEVEIGVDDVEISTNDIPGFVVQCIGNVTVALDITITETLKEEGIAREIINRIQNIRKETGFEVTDKIAVEIEANNEIISSINNNLGYICSETLAERLELVDVVVGGGKQNVEIVEGLLIDIKVIKL